MPTRKRTEQAVAARRRNAEQMSRLGAEFRASRRRRRLTQATAAGRAGVSVGSVSDIERGRGGSYSADTLQLISGIAGRTLRFEPTSDELSEPAGAGHLAIQELVLAMARSRGVARSFELATRPMDPSRSADVALRDDAHRFLEIIECWNTIGDIGGAVRSSGRKCAEASAYGVAIGPLDEAGVAQPYRVGLCWVVRATTRNRALVARYPEIFATRFPGASAGWVRALADGAEPPAENGLVWCDIKATRLFAWRRRRG